jgi:hypothetical protein
VTYPFQMRAFRLVLAIMCGCGVMSAVPALYAQPSRSIRWLISHNGAEALSANAEASKLLDGTQPYVIVNPRKGRPDQLGWKAIPLVSSKSFAEIKKALEQGSLPPGVKGILYDIEKWQFTPEEEQRNPAYYEKLAAELVHAHGLIFVATPAADLVAVLAPEQRSKRYDAYLRLGLAADAARYADVIDIQAQGAELNTELYANFVRHAAAQARQANPKVIVLAGLSTNPAGQHVTAQDILRAIAATHTVVDGYWLNIPQPGLYCPRCDEFRPDIAIEVLRSLAGGA